jgi:5'-3' exoribonuclease 2
MLFFLLCSEIKDYNAIDGKSIATMFKFSFSLINLYRTAPDSSKDQLAQQISSMLDIISKVRNLCAFYQMEKLTLELHTLFMCSSGNPKAALSRCKPSLGCFMSMLGHLNYSEVDANALCSAMLDLYHLLVRERHWALIHLAMSSFGYFAARTSFTQLWRFIPGDAALSYNANTGVDIDENRFMTELKAFLQKEAALRGGKWSGEQTRFLVSEGRALKKLVETAAEIPLAPGPEKKAVISKDANKKKRKIPDGLGEGMALLQNGLKVMRSALDETDSAELKDRLAAHLSCLENAVSQIVCFSDKI